MLDPEAGIAQTLAILRAREIEDVRYDLALDVPPDPTGPVSGRVSIGFALADGSRPLVIDFDAGRSRVQSVSIGGMQLRYRLVNGHIVIDPSQLTARENVIQIAFQAGDLALNRGPDLVYTLFVPARAHTAFPCFDQPDLKARFGLELTMPAGWEAVANGSEVSREMAGDKVRVRFADSHPISTYLFAFACGRFHVETAVGRHRTFRMFHRETDAGKVSRNRDVVFDLHQSALDWLEEYTALPYPFCKFDFVLIPSFQFSGMEHPGAVFYNGGALLLDESATESQLLARAQLVAHETAHMWFGNLVTMRWFDDVWVKEVFASFLADRVVGPAFPEVNHDLRFLVAHLPPAYAVDRTAGAHPIRQTLDNLKDASSLYGPIIYHKAPVVMAQLERLIGAPTLREGLRAYLRRFAFGSASWPDLVGVLRDHTGEDLAAWSRAWVGQPGRPAIRTAATRDDRGLVSELGFVQEDPDAATSGHWKQQVDVLVGTAAETHKIQVALRAGRINVSGLQSLGSIELVLPAVGGPGYGEFVIDEETRQLLLQNVGNLGEPLARGVAWITLWDDLLGRRISPEAFIEAAIRALPVEDAEQNVELVTGYLERTFWKFLRPDVRDAFSLGLEQAFRSGFEQSPSPTLKATYFSRFRSAATTPSGLALLEATWTRRRKIDGLTLGEGDEIAMALDLAVRGVGGAAGILEEQRARISNADRKARFEFVMPAVSERQDVRDAFFRALADVSNRRHEPWVIEGLTYLNHPLRAAAAEKYLQPALELLTEIKDTGDIFFPKNWTDAMLGGHSSRAAADVVRRFLADRPGYPLALRRIILQSADTLFRAAAIANPSP